MSVHGCQLNNKHKALRIKLNIPTEVPGFITQQMLNGITNKRWLLTFQILKTKKDCPNGAVYKNCRLFPTLQTLLSSDVKVGAAIVGTPPYTRGTFEDGKYYTTFLKKCSKTCLSVWTYNETRANLHFWIVRRSHFPDKDLELKLAEAGIHTFCEKPSTSLEPEKFANYSKTVSDSAKKKESFFPLVTCLGTK